MPNTSAISPFIFSCGGGLVLDKDAFNMQPGEALVLQNFEPSINGGYRRLTGTTKYSSTQVNGNTDKVIGVTVFNNTIIAAAGANVKYSTGGTWTSITTARTSAVRYNFDEYNFNGTDKLIMVDQTNIPASWDGSTYKLLNGAAGTGSGTAPVNPKFVAVFKNHIFYAGMSASPQEVFFTAPFSEDDYTVANGAGMIKVDNNITGIKSFRDSLVIFCEDQIFRLIGSSAADFKIELVTRNIGCTDGFSIQEIGGDLLFLAPDGLRTVAGTARIDDVELGSVSKAIQPRINDIGYDNISSVVIRTKSQYRLFYPTTSGAAASSKGLLGTLKRNIQGGIGYEWADIRGLKPSCMASGFISNVEVVVGGTYNGYVIQHESGDTFDGTNIASIYRSPDLTMGDPGIRKLMQRVIFNYETEGDIAGELRLRYDFDDPASPSPVKYDFTSGGGLFVYGGSGSLYGTAVYGSSGNPFLRQSVEGSGFTVALKVDANNNKKPFSIKGFQLEFTPGGRR